MAKPKRMSEMFASSTEKGGDITMATATPPYSSDGPTLPVLGDTNEQTAGTSKAPEGGHTKDSKARKKRKAQNQSSGPAPKKQMQPPAPPTIDRRLYEPWTLLPPELLKLLETQARLRTTQNIISVVFTKNQNVKSGINRLKTYLGAYRGRTSEIEVPDALQHDDFIIAVSAQGEGTTKLVGIVDMVRRIVAPSGNEQLSDEKVETWHVYTVLTSIDTERRIKSKDNELLQSNSEDNGKMQDTPEEEAFEPIEIDGQGEQNKDRDNDARNAQKRRTPVLTVWMTRKRIAAFKNAFGEQTLKAIKSPQEDD